MSEKETTDIRHLKSNHEEADTKIILHAHDIHVFIFTLNASQHLNSIIYCCLPLIERRRQEVQLS